MKANPEANDNNKKNEMKRSVIKESYQTDIWN